MPIARLHLASRFAAIVGHAFPLKCCAAVPEFGTYLYCGSVPTIAVARPCRGVGGDFLLASAIGRESAIAAAGVEQPQAGNHLVGLQSRLRMCVYCVIIFSWPLARGSGCGRSWDAIGSRAAWVADAFDATTQGQCSTARFGRVCLAEFATAARTFEKSCRASVGVVYRGAYIIPAGTIADNHRLIAAAACGGLLREHERTDFTRAHGELPAAGNADCTGSATVAHSRVKAVWHFVVASNDFQVATGKPHRNTLLVRATCINWLGIGQGHLASSLRRMSSRQA